MTTQFIATHSKKRTTLQFTKSIWLTHAQTKTRTVNKSRIEKNKRHINQTPSRKTIRSFFRIDHFPRLNGAIRALDSPFPRRAFRNYSFDILIRNSVRGMSTAAISPAVGTCSRGLPCLGIAVSFFLLRKLAGKCFCVPLALTRTIRNEVLDAHAHRAMSNQFLIGNSVSYLVVGR